VPPPLLWTFGPDISHTASKCRISECRISLKMSDFQLKMSDLYSDLATRMAIMARSARVARDFFLIGHFKHF